MKKTAAMNKIFSLIKLKHNVKLCFNKAKFVEFTAYFKRLFSMLAGFMIYLKISQSQAVHDL